MMKAQTSRRELLRRGLVWLAAGMGLPALRSGLSVMAAAPVSSLDVRALGARGNGVSDDTAAIQAAIDQVHSRGGGTVLFPPGTYLVRSVNIYPGITYLGDRATLKRPDDPRGEFPENLRMFTTREKRYSAGTDSPPLVIRNLTFDGNIEHQGVKQSTEQSHLLFLQADPRQPGRLKAVIDGCTFQNSPSDGITVYVNVDVEITNTTAISCRRGGLVFNGGNSKARVTNFKSLRGTQRSRIDMEIAGRGYGGTQAVDIVMNNVYCDGNVELEIVGGTVEATNVQLMGPLLAVLGRGRGTARFSNSTIRLGALPGSRLQSPGDVTFTNCRLEVWKFAGYEIAGRPRTAPRAAKNVLQAINVHWDDRTNQTVRLVNCEFVVDRATVPASDSVIAVFTQQDPANSGNRLIVEGGTISADYDTGFLMERGGDWTVRGMVVRAPKAFRLNAPRGFPYRVVLQDVMVGSTRLSRTLSGEGRFEYP